ncbi:uncharacterized protein BJX67DRAFT_382025 [Aspergillus lucknowensis]|uniref:Uncharacterized protein n=1 Tax=Aspergillus lucknowensis TaxID=176173 RepID=A0ABR4LNU4_9EURO
MLGENADNRCIVEEPSRGFLGNLTPSILRYYKYHSRNQFLKDLKDAGATDTREWFLLIGVTEEIFTNNFLEPEYGDFSTWTSFDPELKLLLIRLVKSTPHEAAAGTFQIVLQEAIVTVGMKRSLQYIGTAAHFASIKAKEPDKAWRPRRLPRHRSKNWPSVVLEVAYSETKAKLDSTCDTGSTLGRER